MNLYRYFSKKQIKGGIRVRDLSWKKFSETGCVETYLLLREFEESDSHQLSPEEMYPQEYSSPEYPNM